MSAVKDMKKEMGSSSIATASSLGVCDFLRQIYKMFRLLLTCAATGFENIEPPKTGGFLPRGFPVASYTFLKTYYDEIIRKSKRIDRKIFLTMSDYKIKDINLAHPETDSVSNVIIFCVKFVNSQGFQPIASLLYKANEPESSSIAICAFIHKLIFGLNQIGFVVVGSVSPHYYIFRRVFSILTEVDITQTSCTDPETTLVYNLDEIKGIVHIFDLWKLYDAFFETSRVRDSLFVHFDRVLTCEWDHYDYMQIKKPQLFTKKLLTAEDILKTPSKYILNTKVLDLLRGSHRENPNTEGTRIFFEFLSLIYAPLETGDMEVNKMNQLMEIWDIITEAIGTLHFSSKPNLLVYESYPPSPKTLEGYVRNYLERNPSEKTKKLKEKKQEVKKSHYPEYTGPKTYRTNPPAPEDAFIVDPTKEEVLESIERQVAAGFLIRYELANVWACSIGSLKNVVDDFITRFPKDKMVHASSFDVRHVDWFAAYIKSKNHDLATSMNNDYVLLDLDLAFKSLSPLDGSFEIF